MKKFLIGAVSLIILVLFLNTAYYRWGVYVDLHPGKKADTFTSVKGKEILVDEGKGMEPFEIKGVDLGAGIPGHFATEYAIDKEMVRYDPEYGSQYHSCVHHPVQ